MTPEVLALRHTLDSLRGGVLKKAQGLSEQDSRRSTVGSGTTLAGLLQHLAFVESYWFEEIGMGRKATRGKMSMAVDDSRLLTLLRADYRAACAESDRIIAALGDADAPVPGKGSATNLRALMVHVIVETARHAGHADIIREQIDGKTGR